MIKRDTTCFSSDLDMGRRPELKSDEKRDVSLLFIEILDCEHFFTAEKVLQFIGASVRGRRSLFANSSKITYLGTLLRRDARGGSIPAAVAASASSGTVRGAVAITSTCARHNSIQKPTNM